MTTIKRIETAETAMKNLVCERHVASVASMLLVATITSGSLDSLREAISLSLPSIGLDSRVVT